MTYFFNSFLKNVEIDGLIKKKKKKKKKKRNKHFIMC